ncbi:helix-turn-helix domain-containing protein [Planktotalea sp.]|uniref:helix-turn-helix domain-containing protein n=1 Tax=Planktotalea sp. TaxID=2029877 RepID=UPI003D6AD19F
MSPAAFRLLAELCRMANQDGECWPSLSQLSARIGRSKAAISGYIAELRALDLLATQSQRMANGYNYRLKYCVTFWQEWRARLTRSRAQKALQKTKCSDQLSERRVNSKNHIHKNQPTDAQIVNEPNPTRKGKLVSMFSKWSELSRSAPFPNFNGNVPEDLIVETRNVITKTSPTKLMPSDLETRMHLLWSALNVQCDGESAKQQAQFLSAKGYDNEGLKNLEEHIKSTWKPYWKRPPSEHQFKEFADSAGKIFNEGSMIKVLQQYLRRWEISQKKLQPHSASHNLLLKNAA